MKVREMQADDQDRNRRCYAERNVQRKTSGEAEVGTDVAKRPLGSQADTFDSATHTVPLGRVVILADGRCYGTCCLTNDVCASWRLYRPTMRRDFVSTVHDLHLTELQERSNTPVMVRFWRCLTD